MEPSVDIAFECLPLSAVGRFDVPIDASDVYRARQEKLKAVLETHGAQRTYLPLQRALHLPFRQQPDRRHGQVRFRGRRAD